jgi:hypothetical protein
VWENKIKLMENDTLLWYSLDKAQGSQSLLWPASRERRKLAECPTQQSFVLRILAARKPAILPKTTSSKQKECFRSAALKVLQIWPHFTGPRGYMYMDAVLLLSAIHSSRIEFCQEIALRNYYFLLRFMLVPIFILARGKFKLHKKERNLQ